MKKIIVCNHTKPCYNCTRLYKNMKALEHYYKKKKDVRKTTKTHRPTKER